MVAEFGDVADRHLHSLLFFCVAGSTMLIAVVGLLRLRVWAFFLNIAANVGVAALVWWIDMPAALRALLAATAVGQLVVGLPVLRAMLRRDAEPAAMRHRALTLIGSTVVVALMVAAALHFV